MRAYIYRITNVNTGEQAQGIASQLRDMGYDSESIRDCANSGRLYCQIWKCERLDEIVYYKPKKQPKKEKKGIEDINAEALRLGLSYGEYVARYNM